VEFDNARQLLFLLVFGGTLYEVDNVMCSFLRSMIDRSRWRFQWLYWRSKTPWDTNITPPEVIEFLADAIAGRALDLGCGTGTNAITLARHGWQVTGVDFVPSAIRKARFKAAAAGLAIDFVTADVTDLKGIHGPFDYALDIGCLFGLDADSRMKYADNLIRLLRPGACYMLYAWLPREWLGRMVGITEDQIESMLGKAFIRERMVLGEEKGGASAWYWYRRNNGVK
jgi:SAM-dependent methyltransferase